MQLRKGKWTKPLSQGQTERLQGLLVKDVDFRYQLDWERWKQHINKDMSITKFEREQADILFNACPLTSRPAKSRSLTSVFLGPRHGKAFLSVNVALFVDHFLGLYETAVAICTKV